MPRNALPRCLSHMFKFLFSYFFNDPFFLNPKYWISGLIYHHHPDGHCEMYRNTQHWDLSNKSCQILSLLIHLTWANANSLMCEMDKGVEKSHVWSNWSSLQPCPNFNLMNLTKPMSQSKSCGKRLSRKCFNAEKHEWSNQWTSLSLSKMFFFFGVKYT